MKHTPVKYFKKQLILENKVIKLIAGAVFATATAKAPGIPLVPATWRSASSPGARPLLLRWTVAQTGRGMELAAVAV
jgi:hypothetical protein